MLLPAPRETRDITIARNHNFTKVVSKALDFDKAQITADRIKTQQLFEYVFIILELLDRERRNSAKEQICHSLKKSIDNAT